MIRDTSTPHLDSTKRLSNTKNYGRFAASTSKAEADNQPAPMTAKGLKITKKGGQISGVLGSQEFVPSPTSGLACYPGSPQRVWIDPSRSQRRFDLLRKEDGLISHGLGTEGVLGGSESSDVAGDLDQGCQEHCEDGSGNGCCCCSSGHHSSLEGKEVRRVEVPAPGLEFTQDLGHITRNTSTNDRLNSQSTLLRLNLAMEKSRLETNRHNNINKNSQSSDSSKEVKDSLEALSGLRHRYGYGQSQNSINNSIDKKLRKMVQDFNMEVEAISEEDNLLNSSFSSSKGLIVVDRRLLTLQPALAQPLEGPEDEVCLEDPCKHLGSSPSRGSRSVGGLQISPSLNLANMVRPVEPYESFLDDLEASQDGDEDEEGVMDVLVTAHWQPGHGVALVEEFINSEDESEDESEDNESGIFEEDLRVMALQERPEDRPDVVEVEEAQPVSLRTYSGETSILEEDQPLPAPREGHQQGEQPQQRSFNCCFSLLTSKELNSRTYGINIENRSRVEFLRFDKPTSKTLKIGSLPCLPPQKHHQCSGKGQCGCHHHEHSSQKLRKRWPSAGCLDHPSSHFNNIEGKEHHAGHLRRVYPFDPAAGNNELDALIGEQKTCEMCHKELRSGEYAACYKLCEHFFYEECLIQAVMKYLNQDSSYNGLEIMCPICVRKGLRHSPHC